MIAHLVFNPQLLRDVSKETAAAFNADGTLDPKHTYKSCPQLNAVWLEALRMSAASTVLRTITSDTVIGGKVLRKGNQLLISARQLHFQSDVFGPRTNGFDHTRFLEKPELEGNAAFRPFGGGVTKCPGRNLAKYVALNLVVLVFHHFEVTADPDQQFPAYRERKPAIGIVSGEGDLRVRVRPRVKFSGNFLYSGMP
jgi:cytochrome P450